MKKKILLCATLMALGSFFNFGNNGFQNKATAQVEVEAVGTILEAIVDLFCPDDPQNRCKHGICLDGACISFRKACTQPKGEKC